ncbi:DUF6069 family protein [Actinomadura parmotrematis]|uniref:Uncharacterized protein n=1 Tax=Actinomadura parmotrematis TaxID=2864039 RepID=A0ABS7G1W2_9ACTN|nr:DUF6069 family protein [Actinomadura parmotrematis]MBW8486694.1 hypothetical protein [Actinomadura parmotrematis]
MNSTKDTGVVAGPASDRTGRPHRFRGLVGTGLAGALAAMAVTTLAAALLHWGARPAARFVRTAVSLTVISFVPAVLSGASTATIIALLALHLVPAAVMIPILARSLGRRQDAPAA